MGGMDTRAASPVIPHAERARPRDGLRRRAARGTIVNAAFQVGIAGLNLLRRLVVAAFLTAAQFGVWGVLLTALLAIVFVKNAGIGDKFVQQSEDDQEVAF